MFVIHHTKYKAVSRRTYAVQTAECTAADFTHSQEFSQALAYINRLFKELGDLLFKKSVEGIFRKIDFVCRKQR